MQSFLLFALLVLILVAVFALSKRRLIRNAVAVLLFLMMGHVLFFASGSVRSHAELAKQQGVTLEGNVDSDVDPVLMDTQAIGRALNNLIGNALRHAPGGRVSVWVRRTGKGVEVTVSDTGEGIRAEDIQHIFERFYRGDASRSRSRGAGAGLGLAIARGIVRAHGGDIRVESEVGKGAQFTFHIP